MQQFPYPAYPPVPPRPVVTDEMIRQNEKKKLRSKSNGLGFLILTYYSSLQVSAIGIMLLFNAFGISLTDNHVAEYLLDIAASVFAALIPGLIYLAASGYRLRDSFKNTHVGPMLLIPLVLLGMGCSMAANMLTQLFINNISLFGLENHAGEIDISSHTPLEIVLSVIAIAIVPAFAEEFVFRGIVLGSLKKYGTAFAVVVSSIMFSAMHSNTTQIVFVFFLGTIFGVVDVITDSIVPSLVLHFLNNFFATLMDLLTKSNVFDETTTYTLYYIVTFLFCIGGVFSFLYLYKAKRDIFRITNKDKPEYRYAEKLTLKDKYNAFFINAGMMISMSIFLLMTILNFFPGVS